MSEAYCCEACDGDAVWRIERHGDAAVTWACEVHLHAVLFDLKRPGEATACTVTPSSWGVLWAAAEATTGTSEDANE